MIERLAEYIYLRVMTGPGKHPDKETVKKLSFLYPFDDVDKAYRDFCVRRIKVTLVTVLAGIILGCFMKISFLSGRNIDDPGIERAEWNGKKQRLELYAVSGDDRYEVDLVVGPRKLGTSELDTYAGRFEEEIGQLICGENPDLEHVSGDLVLSEKYEGYPFKFSWRSSEPRRISAFGGKVDSSEEADVMLTVSFSYGEYSGSLEVPVHVVRPVMSEAEILEEGIGRYLAESEENHRDEKILNLPAEYDGRTLTWEYRTEDDSSLIFGLFIFVAVIIYMASGKDLNSKTEKKKEDMRRSYPKVLRQLSLYVGAGMTVKAAFTRISEEPSGEGESIYGEMKIACLEMNRGVSEPECYERFGKRTGMPEYIKLAGLLSQNLKRGNPGFISRLKEEASVSMRERVLESRKAGEVAQTKLLAPMMMMLAVVMVMIMIPAMTGIKI